MAINFNNVDFPVPFFPTRPMRWPLGMATETLSNNSLPEIRYVRLLMLIIITYDEGFQIICCSSAFGYLNVFYFLLKEYHGSWENDFWSQKF